MDANGIGTDATMAEHIAKIKERQYVQTQPRGGAGGGIAENNNNNRGGRGGRVARGGGRGGRATNNAGGRGGGGNASVQQFIPTTLGVALIEGYDNMGLETSLGKPFLRKEMEIKMKEICTGTKTRNDFVHETLEQYRDVFVRTQQQVDVLKAVCSLPAPSFFLLTLPLPFLSLQAMEKILDHVGFYAKRLEITDVGLSIRLVGNTSLGSSPDFRQRHDFV